MATATMDKPETEVKETETKAEDSKPKMPFGEPA